MPRFCLVTMVIYGLLTAFSPNWYQGSEFNPAWLLANVCCVELYTVAPRAVVPQRLLFEVMPLGMSELPVRCVNLCIFASMPYNHIWNFLWPSRECLTL